MDLGTLTIIKVPRAIRRKFAAYAKANGLTQPEALAKMLEIVEKVEGK